ncbi:hypothetical protein RJ640_012368 [Escallonia rubra]|uniref:Uncharacterized protein n=1 Tax=Escallonia rubra TaxID=112253 RepID=A0AA88U0Y5_9ASTE|nr:hypothetical protein RJ640_012368 [Escallonia rubra]
MRETGAKRKRSNRMMFCTTDPLVLDRVLGLLATKHHKQLSLANLTVYNYRIQFILMGLLDMYNSGGAIEAIEVSSRLAITIRGREASRFGAYSNLKPRFFCEL